MAVGLLFAAKSLFPAVPPLMPAIGAALLFLSASTGACLGRQVKVAWRRSFPSSGEVWPQGELLVLPVPSTMSAPRVREIVREELAGLRYRPCLRPPQPSPSATLTATKHSLGHWGSPLLHLGLLLIAAGTALIAFTQTWGRTVVVEGERFVDRRGDYVVFRQAPLARVQPMRVKFVVDRVQTAYTTSGQVDDYSATITLLDDQGKPLRRTIIAAGQPLFAGKVTVHRHRFGYAPLLVLGHSRQSAEPFGLAALVVVDTLGQIGDGERYEGEFVEPLSEQRLRLRFFPDWEARAGRNLSSRPRRPAVELALLQPDTRQTIRSTIIPLGSSSSLNGLVVAFQGYRRWISFTVTSERGRPLLFAGFALAVLGGGLLYLLNPREVHALIDPAGQIKLRGSSKQGASLFAQELAVLSKRIEARLVREGGKSA
ncbi:MAG TPA: hypothetical protein GXX28_05375 [Firmicutes bacterium]|nr:hypothetical protein [Bacillota bacterium]